MPFLDLDSVKGLSNEAAAEKIRTEGYNELPESKKRGIFWIIFEVVHEPMFILLVASGLIYFILGDFTESIGWYTYKIGFTYFEQGYAAALSVIQLLIIIFIGKALLSQLTRVSTASQG